MITANILLTFVGKLIVSSSLLMLFYQLVFKQKATFNNCRKYLLSIFIIAMGASVAKFQVWQPKDTVIEINALQVTKNSTIQDPILPIKNPMVMSNFKVIETENTTFVDSKTSETGLIPYFSQNSWKKWAILLYSIISCVLFILLIPQVVLLNRIKRQGKTSCEKGYKIVEHDKIETPFSFLKTIFLPTGMTSSKRSVIIEHEQNHIVHKHYIDVFVCEIVCRILWFNPFFWWVRKELRDVDEFQVDNSILEQGYDLHQYQTILLEEIMEQRHSLANGFNTSFIIKRFRLMKEQYTIRLKKVRTFATLPFVLIVLALFTFTKGEGKIKYIVINESVKTTTILLDSSNNQTTDPEIILKDIISTTQEKTLLPKSTVTTTPKDKKAPSTNKKETIQERDERILNNAYMVPDNQIQISPKRVTRYEIFNIERTKEYTKLVIAYPNCFNGHWYYANSLSRLVDLNTGIDYRIVKMQGNIPLGKTFVISGYAKTPILLTYYFEPIPETAHELRWIDIERPNAEIPSNGYEKFDLGIIYPNQYPKGKVIR